MAPLDNPRTRSRRQRLLLLALAAYPAWLAMMAVHEAGHALHAVTSGGRIQRISIPLLDFSRTDLAINPHPLWVAWGGPLWGCLIPLALLTIATALRRLVNPLRLFAGFCLIANGAYIGLGPWMTAGDGHDLLRHGARAWMLIAFGATAFAGGIFLWHRASDETEGA
jgi:hypothetical protein